MPVLKPKYQSIKVFRPTGTKYAEATGSTPMEAYLKAVGQFVEEFRVLPVQEREVIEIMGVTLRYHATIFELPDERHPHMR